MVSGTRLIWGLFMSPFSLLKTNSNFLESFRASKLLKVKGFPVESCLFSLFQSHCKTSSQQCSSTYSSHNTYEWDLCSTSVLFLLYMIVITPNTSSKSHCSPH